MIPRDKTKKNGSTVWTLLKKGIHGTAHLITKSKRDPAILPDIEDIARKAQIGEPIEADLEMFGATLFVLGIFGALISVVLTEILIKIFLLFLHGL